MSKQSAPIRESVTTINNDGSRNFLHPSDVSGLHTTARRIFAFILIALFISLPWININGFPAIFLDVISRRFHFFGYTIATQDLWILFFFITGFGFSLFFITSILGRVWCGWACPQTVFLEHVFRKIERLIDGDHASQKRLDKLAWTSTEKQIKRGGKVLIYLFICTFIAHIFLAYFISLPELYQYIIHKPTEHYGAFLFVMSTTAVLFFNFFWFREQLCLIICPYGRFQSALIDDDSIIIGYDAKRGEPRGPAKSEDAGDCIDCKKCIQVCPTGIDIRQGLQMECIGCSNCIDACNNIMSKLNRPKGLVRYDSLNNFEGKKSRILRPRIYFYFFMLLVGATVMTYSLSRIKPAYLSVNRMTGTPYVISEKGIRNQFTVSLINKQHNVMKLKIELENVPDSLEVIGLEELIILEPMQETQQPMVLQFSINDFPGRFKAKVIAHDEENNFQITRDFEFIGPDPKRLQKRFSNNEEK